MEVELLEQHGGVVTSQEDHGQLSLGRRQKFVDQAGRQRLGVVDEDELGSLLVYLVGDERDDGNGKRVDLRLPQRG
jgi:hypothetical protein